MSKRYTGGIVSATRPTTSGGELGSASGMWEIEQQGRLQAAGQWPVPYVPKYVEEVFSSYLYKGNGNNNGNDVPNGIVFGGVPTNGTILHFTGDSLSDSAPVPCPFSNVGATVNTTTKKYGTGSLYFNGTSTNIITANSAGLRFGTGDFTVECWVYNVSGGNQGIFHLGDNFGLGCVFVNMYPSGFFQWGWDSSYAGSVGSFPSNQWIHVALVRQSGVMKLYVNGTQVGSNNTFAGSINLGRIWVGNYYDTNYGFNGYIDDFRVSNKAVYTANFTPPAQALPIDTIISGTNYGGMTWMKCRTTAYSNALFDTIRGGANTLRSNTTDGNSTAGSIAFNTSGWCVNTSNGQFNANTDTFVSWSFRRQARFFDIVTWNGDGTSARAIPHSLGSAPGFILVKGTNTVTNWKVYHRSLGESREVILNSSSVSSSSTSWGSTAPTSSVFYVGDTNNTSTVTYVAYVFAHNAGGFGPTGADNIISCGSFVSTGANQRVDVDLGYQPQWVLVRRSDGSGGQWYVMDNMRGFPAVNSESSNDPTSKTLYPNLTNAEGDFSIALRTNGFSMPGGQFVAAGETYIYVAIRRGPMKTPTSGASVFNPTAITGAAGSAITTGFPIDLELARYKSFSNSTWVVDRLRGFPVTVSGDSSTLSTNTTNASFSNGGYPNSCDWDNTKALIGNNLATSAGIWWHFRRAPGFMDVVCYTGTGSARTVSHNLGVAPEMMIVKSRSTTWNWSVYHSALSATKFILLDSNGGAVTQSTVWNDTAPTSSVFSVGSAGYTNASGGNYVAYLFASCPGVSKVGSFTQVAGVDTAVDCGFTAGARFILIKSTATTSNDDWYVWDSARGITSGTDPYLRLNSANAEVTSSNAIVPNASGFTTSGSWWSAGTYIFLAIA